VVLVRTNRPRTQLEKLTRNEATWAATTSRTEKRRPNRDQALGQAAGIIHVELPIKEGMVRFLSEILSADYAAYRKFKTRKSDLRNLRIKKNAKPPDWPSEHPLQLRPKLNQK